MSGIDDVIEHLYASNISSGEALAAVTQVKDTLQLAHGKLQDAQNHVAAATGNATIDTLNTAFMVINAAKLAVEHAISGLAPIPDNIGQAQELTNEYMGRLQG